MSASLRHPCPDWVFAGNLPTAVPDSIAETLLLPTSMEPGKASQKWLKKHPDLAVLVLVVDAASVGWISELVSFLRDRLQNRHTRLVCFADVEARAALTNKVDEWDIHRLQSLSDWSEEFLVQLVLAEGGAYLRSTGQRHRREAELALLTWLARSGRDEELGLKHLRDVSELLTRLIGARSLLLDADKHILQTYPSELQALEWAEVISAQFADCDLGEQPIRVQLNATLAVHERASELLPEAVTGSLLIPFRCYDDIRGYLLVFLTPVELQQLDVATVNLLEKTSDQLRALTERQQSEQRLKIQYERLQETLNQLYSTQEQLFHAEKLSSLGQLAAGIAHEINNPVSYVLSNFEPLDDYISGMSELIKLHDQFSRALDLGDDQLHQQLRNDIHAREESIDLEFVLEDVFALVSDSRKGLTRVCDIVKNLKNFAHKDQLESADFDLVECYRDSIGILSHQISQRIEIRENLPAQALVHGNSGMLGQVFINLIQNAIHAMEGAGEISVSMSEGAGVWVVRICDNGPGIPDEIRKKIFDPFFTTKPVGQGTGLGLSTVYSIIERHQGSIAAEDAPGGGACFVIRLPAL